MMRSPAALVLRKAPAASGVSLVPPLQLMLTTRTPCPAAQIVALYMSLSEPMMLIGRIRQLAAPSHSDIVIDNGRGHTRAHGGMKDAFGIGNGLVGINVPTGHRIGRQIRMVHLKRCIHDSDRYRLAAESCVPGLEAFDDVMMPLLVKALGHWE
jgi:hypothetical protein